MARTVLVACALLALHSVPANAQSPEAESLFREGKALLKKGKIAEACDKFEASDKIEPKAGTELSLGDCREKNKQLATAWAVFLKAASTAKKENDSKRAAEAKRRAKLLGPKLKYLTIKVAEDRKYEGLEITRDGEPLDPAVWNQRVPIDQGTHLLVGKAPNRETWKEELEIDQADEETELPELAEVAAPVDKPVKKKPKKKTPPPEPPRRYVGLTIAFTATALVGAGAGIGFGLRARSLQGDADRRCPNDNCLDPQALDLNKQARSNALIANAGYIVGGLGLVGAVVFYLKGKPRAADITVVPAVTSDEAGVVLRGNF